MNMENYLGSYFKLLIKGNVIFQYVKNFMICFQTGFLLIISYARNITES